MKHADRQTDKTLPSNLHSFCILCIKDTFMHFQRDSNVQPQWFERV